MNKSTLPKRATFILPEEPRDPWPPAWQRILALIVLSSLLGWMMGHTVGWIGQ